MEALTEGEQQLLLAVASLPGRHGALLRWPADTPADREHLQRFGEYWFGTYRVDWQAAYHSLTDRQLLTQEATSYRVTPEGMRVLQALTRQTPIYLYEYNLYYGRAQQSEAHQAFCRQVYGEDLQQHGLANISELSLLLNTLALTPEQRVLDAGCGSGRITDWLQRQSGAYFSGIDLSAQGIQEAQRLANPHLQFSVDNLLDLSLPAHHFDVVVAIDTIYYVPDLNQLISQFLRVLKPQGRMGIFCSNWTWLDEDKSSLSADQNPLAITLRQAGLSYQAFDLTDESKAHWRLKLETLEALKPAFLAEGNQALFEHRYDEAWRYANWPEDATSRYLYLVQTP